MIQSNSYSCEKTATVIFRSPSIETIEHPEWSSLQFIRGCSSKLIATRSTIAFSIIAIRKQLFVDKLEATATQLSNVTENATPNRTRKINPRITSINQKIDHLNPTILQISKANLCICVAILISEIYRIHRNTGSFSEDDRSCALRCIAINKSHRNIINRVTIRRTDHVMLEATFLVRRRDVWQFEFDRAGALRHCRGREGGRGGKREMRV